MAPRPAIIRQADLTRIAKAMQAAGEESWRLEIDASGKISIITDKSGATLSKSDWD